MEKWLKWAMEIQSLAQAGLTYTDNVYDIERYERLREISAEIISEKSNISIDKVKDEVKTKIANDMRSTDSNFNINAIKALREEYGLKITDSDLKKSYEDIYGE